MSKRRGNGEGSITRRKDGRYMARFSDAVGKRRTVYGATRKEAADKLTAALAAVNGGAYNFDADGLMVGEFLDKWLDAIHGSVKAVSWENYARTVRLHLKPALGGVKLSKLSPGRVQSLYDEKRRTLSPATVQLIHAVLTRALSQAQRWRLVTENVATLTTRPKRRAAPRR